MTTDISEATEHEICGHPCDDYILGIGCKCYDGSLDNDDDDDEEENYNDLPDWDDYDEYDNEDEVARRGQVIK